MQIKRLRMDEGVSRAGRGLSPHLFQLPPSGAVRVWAYFNNDREGYAIKNARGLLRQLKRAAL